MSLKLVTVFGGSGFVGRHVVQRLANRGIKVRVAVRDPEAAIYLKPMGDVGQVMPVQANLRNEASVRAALKGADAVINLVGILAEGGRQKFDAVHARGAAVVARLAAEEGVAQLVHMSALGADATSKAKYARSKAAGEAAVLNAFPTASIVRPSVIFGPQDGFFNKFGQMTKTSPALPLIGGGKAKFQPVYVGNVADAIMACLDDAANQGKTFELVGPTVYSFKEILELVLRECGVHRGMVPLPLFAAKMLGAVVQYVPGAPLTLDQMRLLEKDNVASGELPGLEELGIEAQAAETILPTYMVSYRPGGQYNPMQPA